MSRVLLGILSAFWIIGGIINLVGSSAGWSNVPPVWLSWLIILVAIISLIVVAADTKDNGKQ